GDAGDTAGGQSRQGGAGDRIRVRLSGHLGVGGQRDQPAQVIEHRDQVVGREQGGGAATEEHGVDAVVGVTGRLIGSLDQIHLPHRVGRVLALRSAPSELGGGIGVEVAVSAAYR